MGFLWILTLSKKHFFYEKTKINKIMVFFMESSNFHFFYHLNRIETSYLTIDPLYGDRGENKRCIVQIVLRFFVWSDFEAVSNAALLLVVYVAAAECSVCLFGVEVGRVSSFRSANSSLFTRVKLVSNFIKKPVISRLA